MWTARVVGLDGPAARRTATDEAASEAASSSAVVAQSRPAVHGQAEVLGDGPWKSTGYGHLWRALSLD